MGGDGMPHSRAIASTRRRKRVYLRLMRNSSRFAPAFSFSASRFGDEYPEVGNQPLPPGMTVNLDRSGKR